METIKQTAGRTQLGDFAPDFAHYNDDVLFGENWNNPDISTHDRCIVTVTALVASGITDSSLLHHLENARKNGVTRREIAAVITHIGFYAGWPKAWAAFRMAKDVWPVEDDAKTLEEYAATMFFPVGNPNDGYAKYFTGKSYLASVSEEQVGIHNVTFEPGCRNNWHTHLAAEGGGQILVCVGGRGFFQEWGKDPVVMTPGDCVNIPAGVKHWHGATEDSWFSHLSIEVPGKECSNRWEEPVGEEEYRAVCAFGKEK